MNIVTSNSSDRAMVHIRNRRSQEAVRWYVLTLPTAIGGRDNIYSSKGLDAELSRRKRCGEPLFEYFAPSYVETRKVGGKMVNTRKPLLYNYVFIHASENEIFRLKRIMPLYNLFLGYPWANTLISLTCQIMRWRPYAGWQNLIPMSFRCTYRIAVAC